MSDSKTGKKRYKVYIYGAGNEYNKLASYLQLYQDKLEIIGIITTEKQIVSSIDGYPCMTISEMNKDKMDYIIIAVVNWREIKDILGQHGMMGWKDINTGELGQRRPMNTY